MGIEDREIAFAFDLECNEILTEWELEMEAKRLEAMAAGSMQNQLPPELQIERIRQ